MICLGILSVREDRETVGKTKIVEKERFQEGISVVVAEFSLPRERLKQKSRWQKRRLYGKGERFLRKLGADVVIPTIVCGRTFGFPVKAAQWVKCPVVPKEMSEALESVLRGYDHAPDEKTGWVADRECSDVCGTLAIAISQKVRCLGIVTQQREKAERIEEMLIREYGVCPELYREFPWKERGNSILADVNQGKIFMDGMTVLDGKRMGLNLRGYQVDQENLLKQYPDLWEAASFCGWCMRKSG